MFTCNLGCFVRNYPYVMFLMFKKGILMKSFSPNDSAAPLPQSFGLIELFLELVPESVLEELITAAIDKANSPAFTTKRRAHASQNAFFFAIDMLEKALKDYGFVEDTSSKQQPRLIAYHLWDAPVRLRIFQGTQIDSHVIPKGKKGPETRIGIEQNQEHFAPPPLFSKEDFFLGTPRELNISIVFEFSKSHLVVWLAVLSEWKHGKLFFCLEKHRLCAKPLVKNSEPTIKARQDSAKSDSDAAYDEGFSDFRPRTSG